MDHYSILDGDSSPAPSPTIKPDAVEAGQAPLPTASGGGQRPPLCFPGDDGGKSLPEIARRDLDAALQLLAERALYITGASGAAIALRHGEDMICRASAGPSAPELGAHLQVNSGLSGESVQTRKTLRCDDAATDTRVNRESCSILGIVSVVVMPLVREGEVNGVFELLSGRAHAFEERDLVALERLGQMIQTAVEQAEATSRAHEELSGTNEQAAEPLTGARTEDEVSVEPQVGHTAESKSEPTPISKPESPAPIGSTTPVILPSPTPATEEKLQNESKAEPLLSEPAKIKRCEACGFPVSEGRRLCLDCDKAQVFAESESGTQYAPSPEFLAEFAGEKPGWLRSHLYLIGAVVLTAITVVMVLLHRWPL